MRKYLLFVVMALCISVSAKAAPGDTTWVQANNCQLTYYNDYDTVVAFPAVGATTYRKIYMTFTLGKYTCPGYTYGTGSAPWCGDWDYTVQNYLMTPTGDTLELGRFITPYANGSAPRTPYTWTQRYVYDVTDYASKLHDAASMRIHYSGYSGGFTADIKFAFIEGTPERNVVGIQKLWDGSYTYGDTTLGDINDINTHYTPIALTAPAGTQTADLKFTVTGHGSDTVGCCEFASHNYQVMLNSSSIATQTIWRDNCGLNELYPQSGTWIYQRGNWCPGAMVYSRYNVLSGITSGSSFNLGLQFDSYAAITSGTVGYGSYTTFGTLIYYGPINKTLDASIEEIIAPNNNENFFRENPVAGQPIIHIRNSGATTIDSVTFKYGIQDSTMQMYTWVGTLAPLADTEINLAALANLSTIAGSAATYNFIADVVTVNGIADVDATNDTMRTQFIAAPEFPSTFKVLMKTSNLNSDANPSVAETSWAIFDKSTNTIVKQRDNCALSTLYTDTVTLPTGYYKLVITDDSYYGEYYGLSAAFLAGAGGYSPGYLHVTKLVGTLIPMHGYNYSGSFNNDFGQAYTEDFYVVNTTSAVNNVSAQSISMDAYPNPAQNVVNIDFTGMQQINGTLKIIDALGREVNVAKCNSTHQQLNTTSLPNGVYTVVFIEDQNTGKKLQTRIIIAK